MDSSTSSEGMVRSPTSNQSSRNNSPTSNHSNQSLSNDTNTDNDDDDATRATESTSAADNTQNHTLDPSYDDTPSNSTNPTPLKPTTSAKKGE